MEGDRCEYCDGTIRERVLEREVFKHRAGFVILENARVGVCDRCGHRYYGAALLRQVHALATGEVPPERQISVPVARAG